MLEQFCGAGSPAKRPASQASASGSHTVALGT
jgi:hypothetical protein